MTGPRGLAARLCSFPSSSALQSVQPLDEPPQAHLRCKADARRSEGTDDEVGATAPCSAGAAGSGIRITRSATRSASRSNASPGSLTASFVCGVALLKSPLQCGHVPPQAQARLSARGARNATGAGATRRRSAGSLRAVV